MSLAQRSAAAGAPGVGPHLRRVTRLAAHPVLAALLTATVLHVLWWWLIANSGGDIAAQDAWAEFARDHPGSAYNLAWYGGMHPVSYSILSPYLMALAGVRTTILVVGPLSAALLALVLVRSKAIDRPLWPALYGAVAITGNAVSGRVTFGLGAFFALGAVAVIFAWPQQWRTTESRHRLWRGALAGALATLATASSPVAGLFLGIAAAALWLGRRRAAALAIGVPPVLVVAFSAVFFPFEGLQPMGLESSALPVALGIAVVLLVPASWLSVRLGAAVYVAVVLATWIVPSPVGTNVTRLGLLFGGVLLVAAACAPAARRAVHRWAGTPVVTALLVLAIATSSVWQVATAARDAITTAPPKAWAIDVEPLIDQLEARNAGLARVEVVPSSSHREATALAPHINLARGWNRQADAQRNPVFYDDQTPLTAASYRDWLDRWAVHYVVLPTGRPDAAAVAEADLVAGGLSYLRRVWSNPSWRLYKVSSPTPLADPPAVVTRFDAAEVDLYMPRAGTVTVRIPDSPWLSLLDAQGEPVSPPASTDPEEAAVDHEGCLSEGLQRVAPHQAQDDWTVLHATRPGMYRIAAPYKLPRGTACPQERD
ncbi:MAG TPA: MFS transporter [Nocardioides sp.]|nr:MFS transporter [Nocardioides sp.]